METHTAAPPAGPALAVPVPASLLSDERLAKLVGQGNDRAFSALYSRYHQQLYRYAHSIVRHEADAQDVLQSTFTAALSALRRGQRDAPLRPWLYRITHNESISLLRRRRVADELPETIQDTAQSVEATAEGRARLALMGSDLQALPERQRGALVMRELSGLSHDELAQALGISVGAAKQSVFEARQALQDFAEGRAMACDEIQRVVSDGDRRALRGRRVRAHLRDCARCDAFAGAIPERRAALLALSPALPAAAASGLLQQITGAAHHGAGGGGLLASAGGKSLGLALSAKSVAAGIAIVATATVGAVGAVELATHSGGRAVKAHLLQGSGHRSGAGGPAAAAGHSTSASSQAGRVGGHGAIKTHHLSGASAKSGAHGKNHANASHKPTLAGANLNKRGTGLNAHGRNPNARGGNPAASGGNGGGSGTTNPNAHGGNPNAKGGNPNAGGGNSNAHGGNPNAKGGNPNAQGGNPNAGGGNSNAHGGNPNAGGSNPNAAGGGSSNAHGGNPNAGGGNSNAGGSSSSGVGSSNSSGGNSNAGGGSSNAHGGNPNAKGGASS